MSQMLMPSDSVSLDEARFGVDYELCWSAAGPVGLPDIVLVGFEPESVRSRICVFLILLEVTPVT